MSEIYYQHDPSSEGPEDPVHSAEAPAQALSPEETPQPEETPAQAEPAEEPKDSPEIPLPEESVALPEKRSFSPENEEEEDEEEDMADDVDFEALEERLMALQQEIRSLKIPVVMVFEGWSAAGKGTMLGELLEGLDPRGYKVYLCDQPTQEELRYPLARRYWVRMPAAGNISLFAGSWYYDVSNACLVSKRAEKGLAERYQQIVQMESQLIASGALLIKFFLNISKKEQKRRLKALESKKSTRWRVTKEDWAQNKRYDEMMQLYDGMMAHTHFDGALWHVLRSEEKRACKKQMYDIVLDAFEKAVAERKEGARSWDTPTLLHVSSIPTDPIPPLSAVAASQPTEPDYKQAMDQAQKKLRKLQSILFRKQISLALCFEGWDAAGKGGSIRRLTSALDPRGFEVVPISAPTAEEKSHHHLWRFWKALPKNGHVTIFDRTWYGRVMVERVEGFCTQNEWNRAYEEINHFERDLAVHGMVIRKFWLQIDAEEQLRRFQDRQNDPQKQWKITEEDWRNRDKWPAYETAVNEMLERTHTPHAPWVVVEANNKRFARLKILHAVIEAMEQALEEHEE